MGIGSNISIFKDVWITASTSYRILQCNVASNLVTDDELIDSIQESGEKI